MRIRFSLGKALSHRDLCTSLMHMCLPISSSSVGDISKLVMQIPIMGAIFMVYYMAGQLRTMMSSVIYNSKLRMGGGCPLGGSS